jgi:GNAT superfamily N-acetyltransferase
VVTLNDTITVRRGTDEDGAFIAELMEQLGYPTSLSQCEARLKHLAFSGSDLVLVAENNHEILGVLGIHLMPLLHADVDMGRITALVVREDVRGQGIGKSLVQEAERWAWAKGCTRIEVTSGDHRFRAHKFYESVGFRCDERRFLKIKS